MRENLNAYKYVRIADALDSKFSEESDELADEGISGPERAYRGPHIVFPLEKKDVVTLIDFFRKKKVCTRRNRANLVTKNIVSCQMCTKNYMKKGRVFSFL